MRGGRGGGWNSMMINGSGDSSREYTFPLWTVACAVQPQQQGGSSFLHKEVVSFELLLTIFHGVDLIDSKGGRKILRKRGRYLGRKLVGSLRKVMFKSCKKVFIPLTSG